MGLAVRLFVAWAVPLGGADQEVSCAPDEAGHFETAAALRFDAAGRQPAQSIYRVFPPAQYLAQSLALQAGQRLSRAGWRSLIRRQPARPGYEGYPYARLGSILLGLLTIVALAAAVSSWSREGAVIAGFAAALHPQLAFVTSYVDGDAATIAACALLGAALSAWAAKGEGQEGLTLAGAAAGAVLVMKASGWSVLAPAVCWVAWAAAQRKLPFAALTKSVAAAAAVAGPVLAWNAWRQSGDAFGLRHFARYMAAEWRGLPGRETPHALRRMVLDLLRSSFGDFGNMSLPLPGVLVTAFWLFVALGSWLALRRFAAEGGVRRRAGLWLCATLGLNLATVVYECWFVDFQPQGRYLFPALLWVTLAAILVPFEGARRRAWQIGCVAIVGLGCAGMFALLWAHPCRI